MPEVVLIANGAHEERLAMRESGFHRVQHAQAVVVVIPEVVEKAGGQDVGLRQVDAETVEVVKVGAAHAVLAARQAVNRVVVIEDIQPVVKPSLALDQRAGELDPRGELIEMQAAIGGHRRNEVGAAESPAVVAHFGLHVEHTGGAAAAFRRDAAALQVG